MSKSEYQSDLRGIVRGFWNGLYTQDQFQDLMFNAIDRGLTRAWQAGAKKVGIQPKEISPVEQVQLMTLIFQEYSHVPRLSAFVQQNAKSEGGLLRIIFNRVKMWVNRWTDVYNEAMLAGRDDPKLKWVLGATEKHCTTCSKLNGKVKRASTWRASGWKPQGRNLACKGYLCDCSLEPTNEPLSPGPLPTTP